MYDFPYEDKKRLSELAEEAAKANRRIIQIAISRKDVVIGLRNDGKLCKYNFETKGWEDA